jgi:hypothetical protein
MKAILQITMFQSFGIVVHKTYDEIHKTMTVVNWFRIFYANTLMEETPVGHYNVHLCQKITLIIRRTFWEKNAVTYNDILTRENA